jgi:hypothetical protein
MHVNYRAIFTEMLLVQSAAVGAAARCALLAGEQYQQALVTLARKTPSKEGDAAHPGGESAISAASSARLANCARAFAGLPRLSMMIFLSQYDDLRGRRPVVRD